MSLPEIREAAGLQPGEESPSSVDIKKPLRYTINMKTTLKIKILPSEEQFESLKKTMTVFNDSCNYISKLARKNGITSKYELQKLVYYDVKAKFRLTAQMVIRAISKVVEAYKVDRTKLCKFRETGAIVYDERILRFKGLDIVNFWTVDGRQDFPILLGGYQKPQFSRVKGQVDLVLSGGKFYLVAVVETPEEPKYVPKDAIGIDLGIVQIATTSTGKEFNSEKVESVRKRLSALRGRLQSKGTRSAKRHLKRLSGKEARFKRNVNHCISKDLVRTAKDTRASLVLENLKNIRKRVTVRKSERARHSSWAFNQLRAFIEYKAALAGVPVILVNPENTSRECSCCGYTAKENRKSQSEFACKKCGHRENADLNAAKVIARRATVKTPIVAGGFAA